MKQKLAYGAIVVLLAGIGAGCQSYLAFNTDTKFGLDISQSAQQQPEVTMGYQRVAIVSMPVLGTNDGRAYYDANANHDAYSVLGSINIKYDPALSSATGGIRILQIFATGEAARSVATNAALAGLFASDLASIYVKSKGAPTNALPSSASPPSGPGNRASVK
jgi:hypothetical protein